VSSLFFAFSEFLRSDRAEARGKDRFEIAINDALFFDSFDFTAGRCFKTNISRLKPSTNIW